MTEFRSWDVPLADRFDEWCHSLTGDVLTARFTSDHRADFHASVTTMELGPAYASALRHPALTCERAQREIRRSDPELWELCLVLHGDTQVEQDRTTGHAVAGDIMLYDTSRPFVLRTGGPENRALVTHVDRRTLPVPEQTLRSLVARPLPAKTGPGALLAAFLTGLFDQAPSLPPASAAHVGSAALNLAAAYLASLTGTDLPAPTRRQALLLEIQAFVAQNLHEDLSPATVAAAHHISVRYLHHLFHGEELSVSAYIRAQRLERCRQDLHDVRLAALTVAEVGAKWGFTDPATFNRTFKEKTGVPPGEYRRGAGLTPR